MAARTQQLETRLSELLGEQAWRATGLGAPTDIDQLQQRIVTLEQQIVELRLQLEERDQDLAAARAANRELMTQAQRLPADRLTHPPKHLHHTCCAPYSSTTSRANCGNAGTLQQLRPGPPENRRHSSLGYQPPAGYAATCTHR